MMKVVEDLPPLRGMLSGNFGSSKGIFVAILVQGRPDFNKLMLDLACLEHNFRQKTLPLEKMPSLIILYKISLPK